MIASRVLQHISPTLPFTLVESSPTLVSSAYQKYLNDKHRETKIQLSQEESKIAHLSHISNGLYHKHGFVISPDVRGHMT